MSSLVTMLTLDEDIILSSLIFERICDEEDCPLIEVHKLPERERVRWLKELSEEKKKEIMAHYEAHIEKHNAKLWND